MAISRLLGASRTQASGHGDHFPFAPRATPPPRPLRPAGREPAGGRRPGPIPREKPVKSKMRARALRVLVRRILRKHGYPPDKQERATQTVLAQAELLSER